MYLVHRKALAVGGTAAAILGIGGTAFAVTGTDTTAGTPASSVQQNAKPGEDGKHGKHGKGKLLKRLEHGQIVTKGKDGAVTHTLWVGSVTAVSATSLTVKATDGKTQTYVITKDTVVKQRTKGAKPTDSSIAKVAKGDRVAAAGTGTGTVTAKRVVELPAK